MKSDMKTWLKITGLAAVLLALSLPASAQTAYPAHAITIVLPFGPGSGTDLVSRVLGQRLSSALGQPVVIDNRPGANGTVAATYVANAKPDGYTLFMGTNSTHGANPALQKAITYDPVKDFTGVNRIAVFTSIVVVDPALPVKNMRELITYGKTNQLTLATGNASGVVMGETLARAVQWKLLRVPYKSNPQAMMDVMGGRVNFMFTDIAAAQSQVKSGKLRAVAAATAQRSALMPDLPTLAESGVPGYDLSGWVGLFAPVGTPRPIVEKLNAEITKILNDPDMRTKVADIGADASPMSAADFTTWMHSEVQKWTSLVKQAGMEPE